MKTEIAIIEAMRPLSTDYNDNTMFHHWVDYELAIDEMQFHAVDKPSLIEYINKRLSGSRKDSGEHDAVTDCASNIEETLTEYQGEFKYV